MGKLADLLLWE